MKKIKRQKRRQKDDMKILTIEGDFIYSGLLLIGISVSFSQNLQTAT